MKRWILTCFATLSLLALIAGAISGPATAAPGGNNANAKACQKGGWATRARQDTPSIAFVSENECVSFGAQGGAIVKYVAPTPTPLPTMTPVPTPEVPLTPCEAAAKAAGFDPTAFTNIVVGAGDPVSLDYFTNTAGADLFCASNDGSKVDRLDAGDLFIGGDDFDSVEIMDGGTFYGGNSPDYVNAMYGGTFYGGLDNDSVYYMQGGTFNGGEGDDRVSEPVGGTFNQD